jgi:hypothetical protein
VSVPPLLETGPKLKVEMRCRIRKLPESMRCDRMYQNPQFWYDFLAWEHTARWRSTFHGEYQPWQAFLIEDSPLPPDEADEEEEDDDHFDIVKEEAGQAMEAAVPLGIGDLPPEYQAVVAVGYDEEALLQQVLEASKVDEDKIIPGYSDIIALMGMVAEHLVLLPPPPPLPPHAPLLAAYEGQEVPPLLGVQRHQRRHDHPHGSGHQPAIAAPAGGHRRPHLRRRRVAGGYTAAVHRGMWRSY